MKNVELAARQLEQSERGQMTCKLLRDFLKSNPVKGLDFQNSEAVAVLITTFMLGDGSNACAVIEALEGVIKRNSWTLLEANGQ